MAFLGKEYTLERDENFDGFLRYTGVPDDKIAAVTSVKPKNKIVQNGDNTYTFTICSPHENKEHIFTPGQEFEDTMRSGKTDSIIVKVTFTIDGNTVTQIVKSERRTLTFKKEYNGDELVETIAASTWDGVARRYFKA